MFGQEEFPASGAGLVGVDSILQAADTLAGVPAPQGAAQAAPRNPSEGTAGVQQDTAVVQNGRLDHFPAWEALDQKRLPHARAISPANKPASLRLHGFKPSGEKPRHIELWQALMERSPDNRPRNWTTEKLVEALCKTPTATQVAATMWASDGDAQSPSAAAAAGVVVALVPASAGADTGDDAKKPRWSRDKNVRIIMVIAELAAEFLQRDRKLDRQEMDAKGSDSFWEKAAALFNSSKHYLGVPIRTS